MKQRNLLRIAIGLLMISSCTEISKEERLFTSEIQEIKKEFAPDKRVALFDVLAAQEGDAIVLKGESNLPDAVNALMQRLNAEDVTFTDSIQLLPSSALQGKTNAVINISVANLRSNPKHSAELATQATLGTPVKVLKREGDWFYIQTPDKYLSWVDNGGITIMDKNRFTEWKKGDKIIYTKTYGHAYDDVTEKNIVSDLVAGDVLELVKLMDKHFVVAFPDGRIALIRTNEAESYFGWIEAMKPNEDNLVATSKKLMGVPYLWGGTSTKGVDCSGFTKTIYFLNGMVIPRDASQQVHTGKQIDENRSFENLKKGDLLFFGRKATDSTKEKVVHVGMWIGNNEFIHASNMVRISSIDRNAENFDEYNLSRYLRSKRILKEEDKDLINLKQTPVFK
ncbi:C40 family peptidase [Maribacter sp. 2308TA10-17]|uniref:C40 family peptidase n=1 Tax=Maribacter sp. 2308TA10-17 TaxID=3386276 RepID=UPI0039BC3796